MTSIRILKHNFSLENGYFYQHAVAFTFLDNINFDERQMKENAYWPGR